MMDNKIFIGLTKKKQETSFKYIFKENILHYFKRQNLAYTLDIDDDFSSAIFAYVEDLALYYPTLKKKNVPISVLALTAKDDALEDKNDKTKYSLSQHAFNYYSRVDKVFASYKSQVEFLEFQGIRNNVSLIKPSLTFYPDEENSETVKNAFKSFYCVPKDKKAVICLGTYEKKEELDLFNGIARDFPEYEFFFFGETGQTQVKVKLLQRLAYSPNATYLDVIPEQLYRSVLLSADCLFVPQKMIINPQYIIDFMGHGVLVIANQNMNYQDVINSDTALVFHNFAELYHMMKNFPVENKAKEASKFIDSIVLK